jgi:hypothetical protein
MFGQHRHYFSFGAIPKETSSTSLPQAGRLGALPAEGHPISSMILQRRGRVRGFKPSRDERKRGAMRSTHQVTNAPTYQF